MSILEPVHTRLSHWAEDRDIPTDADGYVQNLPDNFVVNLSPETVQDFSDGKGAELGGGGRGKIQALHSSSALACNFFEYWRQRDDRSVLERALGLDSRIRSIRFERRFPTGLAGTSPHLDVLLETDQTLIGIESKFLEAYRGSRKEPPFRPSYFPMERRLWSDLGMVRCQELAEAFSERQTRFEFLDAPQLLKHALGLRKATPDDDVSLWYLWFDIGGPPGASHAREIREFENRVGAELGFVAWSYAELVERMAGSDQESEHREYLLYLRTRYGFGDSAPGH